MVCLWKKKIVLFLIVGPKNLATWPISYQTQGPRRGGRNVRGRTKKAQIARRRCRGQSCPRQTEITEGKSSMPPKAASQSVPRESTSAMSQPWEYGGGENQGEIVTSALNAHN